MNTKPVHASRELTADELNAISGGKGLLSNDKDLQSQDKLGNTKIQTLMSDYGETSRLVSSILKKRDDAAAAVIGKI